MTIQDREFAKNRIEYLLKISSFALDEHDKEALELAIQALSQEPCRDMEEIAEIMKCDADAETKCKMISNILTTKPHYFEAQEPCDDAISRDAAINIASLHCLTIDETVKAIKNLPSVTQKSGKWIRYKDNCLYNQCSYCGASHCREDNFCPNCGARMVEPQESETWNGMHGQITAPKGTFKKIFDDAGK